MTQQATADPDRADGASIYLCFAPHLEHTQERLVNLHTPVDVQVVSGAMTARSSEDLLASRLRQKKGAMPRIPQHGDKQARTAPPCTPQCARDSSPRASWHQDCRALSSPRGTVGRLELSSPPHSPRGRPETPASPTFTLSSAAPSRHGGLAGKTHGLFAAARAGVECSTYLGPTWLACFNGISCIFTSLLCVLCTVPARMYIKVHTAVAKFGRHTHCC